MLKNKLHEWRQGKYWIKKLKRLLRMIEGMRKKLRTLRGNKKKSAEKRFKKLHAQYLTLCNMLVLRAESSEVFCSALSIVKLDYFIEHAKRQMEQIKRRVLNGEKIPHKEKVFSIFEPHTEWIVKGKAGITQELGIKVAIVEDHNSFILHHSVMRKTEDVDIACSLVGETIKKFSAVGVCSFDRGFHSPENKKGLSAVADIVVLPSKGRPHQEELEDEYKKMRNQHAAVESAINCLEHHGLDRVLDFGISGFCRYVSLSVLSYNMHKLGKLVKPSVVKTKISKAA